MCREAFEKLCSEVSLGLEPLGFARSKSTLWTRVHEHTADVISSFREGSSYGAASSASVAVRVHLAIRVLNDDFAGLALNGPGTDDFIGRRPSGYHLSFNARSFSQYDRCRDDLVRFVREHGVPWFSEFGDAAVLVERGDSPLSPEARERLRAALAGRAEPTAITASKKLLGLRKAAGNGMSGV